MLRVLAVLLVLALSAPVAAAQTDVGGFRNVLPPGQNGLDNLGQLALFEATGARPAHNDDQLAMYRDLLYAPGLDGFKDASFGVAPADVERTEHPRDGATVVRDRFGVPHVYGA